MFNYICSLDQEYSRNVEYKMKEWETYQVRNPKASYIQFCALFEQESPNIAANMRFTYWQLEMEFNKHNPPVTHKRKFLESEIVSDSKRFKSEAHFQREQPSSMCVSPKPDAVPHRLQGVTLHSENRVVSTVDGGYPRDLRVQSPTPVKSPSRTGQSINAEKPVSKRVMNSRIYRIPFEENADVIIANEQVNGQKGLYIKLCVHPRQLEHLEYFRNPDLNLPSMNVGDATWNVYCQYWMPSEEVQRVYVNALIAIAEEKQMKVQLDLIRFPEQCIVKVEFNQIKPNEWCIDGPVWFLRHVYFSRISYNVNRFELDGDQQTISCDEAAKDVLQQIVQEYQFVNVV